MALNDEDRQPWLETLNGMMRGWFAAGQGGVLACSALKEKYRETLAPGCRRARYTLCCSMGPRS